MNFRCAYSSDVQTCTAPPKRALCWNNFRGVDEKCFLTKNYRKKFMGVEKSNVGDHLKRVFPKFEADRSHPRGVNDRSKFCQKIACLMQKLLFLSFYCWKMKCRESSETRFGKVLHWSEPSLRGKRPIEMPAPQSTVPPRTDFESNFSRRPNKPSPGDDYQVSWSNYN